MDTEWTKNKKKRTDDADTTNVRKKLTFNCKEGGDVYDVEELCEEDYENDDN